MPTTTKLLAMGVLDEIASSVGATGVTTDFSLSSTFYRILVAIMYIGFGLSIVSIAFSMVMYITSTGDPDKVQKAWRAFIYGVIAAAISLTVQFLRRLILPAFGITDPTIVSGFPS